MIKYNKARKITHEGVRYTVNAWDIAGYVNSRGVALEFVSEADGVPADGVLVRFKHFEKGESGKRELMPQSTYDDIASNYDPYDDTGTWTIPFLNYIGR